MAWYNNKNIWSLGARLEGALGLTPRGTSVRSGQPRRSAAIFNAPASRDAWPTIRGYVYQVALSIERWLSLSNGQVLELERGEDIDTVTTALGSPDLERDRLLEQVKHRETRLTLRSAPAVHAVAWAVGHRVANPSIALVFRYSTNAEIATEAPTPSSDGIAGIVLWERLRLGQLNDAEQEAAIAAIRSILQDAKRPPDLNRKIWARLASFITDGTDEEFLDLVRSFEWSSGQGNVTEVAQRVKSWILERGIATMSQEAQDVFDRLFSFVFQRLTHPGIKRLTVEEREQQLACPTLSATDRAVLEAVATTLREIGRRVEILEETVTSHGRSLSQVQAAVASLASREGVAATIREALSLPDLQMPSLLKHGSRRSESLGVLREQTADHAWIALRGSTGSGKTEMAKLLALDMNGCSAWVRCRNLEPAHVARLLQAIASSRATAPGRPKGNVYQRLCHALGPGSVLVLDDLPRCDASSDLQEQLVLLSQACAEYRVRLITTSAHPVPLALRDELVPPILIETDVPWLTDDEAREILESYGAPSALLTPQYVAFINGVARKHPLLLTATARDLSERAWVDSSESFTSLLSGDFATQIDGEVTQRLLLSISDEGARELLDRLSLIQQSFSIDAVSAVASVSPPIRRPHERAHELMGLWLQPDTGGRLSVSPLVTIRRATDLSPSTKRDCHAVLARLILSGRVLDQREALDVITHLLSAEQDDAAGIIYCQALMQLAQADTAVRDLGWLGFWVSAPLPAGMTLGIRILVRALQIAARRKRGLSIDALTSDLGTLIDRSAEAEAWAVLGALVHVPEIGMGRLPRLLPLLEQGRLASGEPIELPGFRPEELIWYAAASISTLPEQREWLDMFRELSPSQRERAREGAIAEATSLHLADWLWLAEADKPSEEQNWDGVLAELRALGDGATKLGLGSLWACAVRASIVVVAEYKGALEGADSIAQAALQQLAPGDGPARFLITECLGRQYLYVGRTDEALALLKKALVEQTNSYALQRVHALVSASAAAGATTPESAVSYAIDAVAVARSSEIIPSSELVKALGELAIARYYVQDIPRAYEACDEAADVLLASRSDAPSWRDLFVVFGYVLAYIASYSRFASADLQVASIVEGGPPTRGVFLTRSDERASLYGPQRARFLPHLLTMFAERVEQDERAEEWAKRGLADLEGRNDPVVSAELELHSITALVREDRYGDALGAAERVANALTASKLEHERGGDPLASDLDIESLLGSYDSPSREQALDAALMMGLVPVVFRLCQLTLEQPADVQSKAQAAIDACRQMAESGGDRQAWEAAAHVCEQAFMLRTGFAPMADMINTDLFRDHGPLQVVCGLAATVQDDATPLDAISVYIGAGSLLGQLSSGLPSVWRGLALPFIAAYWLQMVEHQPFRFTPPKITKEAVERAADVPSTRRLRAILEAVAMGLRVTLPHEDQSSR